MSIASYKQVMKCLDIIEAELNKIAKSVGHVSFDEFTNNKEK